MSLADLLSGQQTPLGPQAQMPQSQASQLFSQGPSMGPEAIGAMMKPPATPEEFSQRQEGWRGFFQEIRQNQSLRNSLLLASAELLRGPQFGENPGAVFGRALETGTLANMRGKQMEAEAALKARQEDRADQGEARADRALDDNIRRTDSAIQNDAISRSAKEQDMLFAGQRQPLALQGLEQGLAQGQFQLDNQGRMLDDSLATSASQRNFNNARAEKARRPDGQGSPPREEMLLRLLRASNPDATEQEIAQSALSLLHKEGGGEGKFDSNLFGKVFETLSPNDPLHGELLDMAKGKLGVGKEDAGEAPREITIKGKKVKFNSEQFERDKLKANADGIFESHGTKWRLK